MALTLDSILIALNLTPLPYKRFSASEDIVQRYLAWGLLSRDNLRLRIGRCGLAHALSSAIARCGLQRGPTNRSRVLSYRRVGRPSFGAVHSRYSIRPFALMKGVISLTSSSNSY